MFFKFQLLDNCIPGLTIESSYDSLLNRICGPDGLASMHAKIRTHGTFGKYYNKAWSNSLTGTEVAQNALIEATKCMCISPKDVTAIKTLVVDLLKSPTDGLKKV